MENLIISCIRSDGPYYKLLKATERDHLNAFQSLVNNPATDLMSTEYCIRFDENTEEWFGTILDVCCLLPKRGKFVQNLLSSDGIFDVNHLNETIKKAPIHLAAMNIIPNDAALVVLIKYPKTDVNLQDGNGNTVLHILARNPKVQCVRFSKLLTKDEINPNLLNKKDECPAYIMATLKEKNSNNMKEFLKCPKVDFGMVVMNQPLRNVIEENYSELFPYAYLCMKDERRFFNYVNLHKYSKETLETHEQFDFYTYLQYACVQGLTNVVKFLLCEGVDPNGLPKTEGASKMVPLEVAVKQGATNIIQLFINRKDFKLRFWDETVLSNSNAIIDYILRIFIDRSDSPIFKHINFESSFNFLLSKFSENPQLDINYIDKNGFTYLHAVAEKKNIKYMFSLLDHGANIALKKPNGKSIFDNTEHSTIECYLNKCIRYEKEDWLGFDNTKFDIIKFSYNFMNPPKVGSKYFDDYCETDPLMGISENPNLKTLLLHPVLLTFLNIKWSQIKKYYFINLIFYALFWGFLNTYIYLIFFLPNDYYSEVMQWILWISSLLFLIIFSVRESFQLIMSPKKYVLEFENWIEIIIIVLTAGLLCGGLHKNIQSSFSGIVILMTWGVLLNMLGGLAKFAIAVAMLKVVTKNFLRFVPFYLLLMASFGFSLYVLFNGVRNDNKKDTSDDLKDVWFSSLWNTSFKMVVMLSGELEVSSMPFPDKNTKTSQIVVVLCIIFIPVILANLLNGLAVGDIKQIMDEAEVIWLKSKLNFINAFEKNPLIMTLERRSYDNMRLTSFFTRLFRVKLSIFRNIRDTVEENNLSIIKKKENYFAKFSDNTLERIDNEIMEKAMSIIALNVKVHRHENDDKTDYLFLEIEKIHLQMNQKFDKLCSMIKQR